MLFLTHYVYLNRGLFLLKNLYDYTKLKYFIEVILKNQNIFGNLTFIVYDLLLQNSYTFCFVSNSKLVVKR